MKVGPYRQGKIHVLSEKCSTCVFRPGNLMHLHEGRLADLVEQNRSRDTALTCHQTLVNDTQYDADPAVCRGYFDAYQQDITPLRMAVAMNLIEEDPNPRKRELK